MWENLPHDWGSFQNVPVALHALPKFFPTLQIFRPHAGQLGDFMGVPGYPQPSGQRAT